MNNVKRARVLELSDKLSSCMKHQTRTADELCEILGQPLDVDRSCIVSMQESLAQLDKQLEQGRLALRWALERAARDTPVLPRLPFDCWAVIVELALDRRTLARYSSAPVTKGAPREICEPGWLPRSHFVLLAARQTLRTMRCLNHGFHDMIDRRLVLTLNLPNPSSLRCFSWQTYRAMALHMAKHFRQARALVIPELHSRRSRLTKTTHEAVNAVLQTWRDRPLPDGGERVVFSQLKDNSQGDHICLTGVAAVGEQLCLLSNTGEHRCTNYRVAARRFADGLHVYAPRSRWGEFDTDVPVRALWSTFSHHHSRNRLADELRDNCAYAFVELPMRGVVIRDNVDLTFQSIRKFCAAMPQLREVHLINAALPTYALDDYDQWRAEANGRYTIWLHVQRDVDLRDLRQAFKDRGMSRYLLFDADRLIEEAERTGRFVQ